MGIYISQDDVKYPKLLKELGKEMPKQLYYKGRWDESIFENCLAVVGSRRMTTYGKQITQKLVGQIASAGVTIVSGFMYGIDAEAHKAAVDVGGRTIAVMPCGIDRVHPDYQIKLYNDILENNGLIISEYEGDSQPGYWTYPARNRIVAGISKAVLIVEAGEKSGSLITANWAKKFGRKVFALPGQITSLVSTGTNQLIKEGAEILIRADNILEYFELNGSSALTEPAEVGPREVFPRSSLEDKIINHLQREPMEMDLLARNLQTETAELGRTISMMEIKGQIKKENGKYYVS